MKMLPQVAPAMTVKLVSATVLMMASTGAFALNTGTDLNLSAKPASGGMAGASYTKPQESSAAVFGNPAALTQFGGTHFGIGAVFLSPTIKVEQSAINPDGTTGVGFADGSGPRTSQSRAVDYAAPDVAVSYELGDGWYLGTGIEADAGAGVDFRKDPITLPSYSTDPSLSGLPLVVELLSFNINFAVAKKLTPQTSVGGALTVGFGLAQLGTVGPSGSYTGTPFSPGFGGTSASVHDFSAGVSVGLTHQLTPTLMLSAAIKGPIEYGFKNILYAGGGPFSIPAGFQTLKVEQPLELVAGAAFDVAPNWLVEADVVWKNWSQATTYQDVYKDQFLLLLGTQYKTGPWSLRAGYSYAEDIMRDTPNNTLGGVIGLGPIPLGPTSPMPALGTEVVKLVQATLVPVVWNHTISAGVGFDFNSNVRLDAFGAYAIKEHLTRDANIGAALGLPTTDRYRAEASAWAIGAGLNFKF